PSTLLYTASDWDALKTVTLSAAEDADGIDETENLSLTATGAAEYAGKNGEVTVTIIDDDQASMVAPASAVVPEGSSDNLSVALSAQPTADVRVTVTGHVATDLTPTPTVLTFTTTDWNAEQMVTLTAAEDDDFANDQIALTLTASGGGYTGVTHPVAVTITDDDVASIVAPGSAVVPEGSSDNLSVALSAQPPADVRVTVTGHAATDLTPTPTVLTFTTTDWNVAKTIVLTAAEDTDFTDDQVVLTLTASGGGYARVTHPVAVTITDNDVASVVAPGSAVVPEGGTSDLSVALSSPPTADVRVTLTGHATTDLTPTPTVLTFTTTDWNAEQTVVLSAAEDSDFANDQIALTLTASGGGYAGVTHPVAVTITDNEEASVVAPASAVVPEGGTSDLSVALSSPPTADVRVTLTGHATTDLTPT
ncbi:MAG: hypothetical protein OXF79_21775, partial [Chloroflexi bacterium]|nr:hypothetical protein [Chloroflexota bacterium]